MKNFIFSCMAPKKPNVNKTANHKGDKLLQVAKRKAKK